MKVVILAGGLGTRLSEYTESIPKPMVKICNKPIIELIIKHYTKFGFTNFIIAGGYKYKQIKNFFKKKNTHISVKVINTGKNSMTGGRVGRLKKIIGNERFLLTYGDGLSNINIKKLITFHKKYKNIVTLTAVRPPARFGAIKVKNNKAITFKEKSNVDEGWINGGFFICEPEIFKYLKSDKTILERRPFEKISKIKKLGAFKHFGFWQCMDTKRDKEILENSIKQKKYII